MEVRRLLTALQLLEHDFDTLKLAKLISELSTAVRAVVVAPADAAANEAFYTCADALRKALPNAGSNAATSSIRLALREAGLEALTGTNLLRRLNEILEATPFLLPRAAQAIVMFEDQVKTDLQKLDAAIKALQGLNFKATPIPASEYEIGVLMPDSVTKGDLRTIGKEVEEWIFAIDRIQELVDGQPSSNIPVRSISSGSLDLFCSFHATGAAAFLVLSVGVYSIFQVIRNAQKHRAELERLKYPTTITEEMRRYENNLLEKAKEEIVLNLMAKKSKELPADRDGELQTGLKHAIGFVLRRVNEGVDVEVSTPPEAIDTRVETEAEVRAIKQKIEAMRLEMATIIAALPDRSKPILLLTELESGENRDGPGGTTDGEKKGPRGPRSSKRDSIE